MASKAIKQPKSLRFLSGRGAFAGAAGLGAAVVAAVAHANDAVDAGGPFRGDPLIVEGQRQGGNPYADPAAPYKIDRSASSKMTEDILNTAKSLAVIPKDVIDDAGATTFRDVVRTQPGVTIGTGEGGNAFGDRIFIRGFDARNDVYVDGLRDPGVVSREVFAVEQIEILKGPSGAFAGRGSTGGAVSLVSKAPHADNFADLEMSAGTSNTYRVTADVNRKLTDTLNIRFNGMYHNSDTPGRNQVFNNRWGAAIALAWTPTQSLRLSFDYYHLDTDEMPDYGVPYDVANNRPFDVDRNNFYGLVNRDFRNTFANIYTGKIEIAPRDDLTVKSVTRYGKTGNSYVVSAPERPDTSDADPANWTVRANPKNRNSANDYIANQTDATLRLDAGGMRHDIVGGFEISRETIENRPYSFLDSEDPSTGLSISPTTVIQNLWNPNPYAPWPFPLTSGDSSSRTKVEEGAIYLLDTTWISENFSISGGLRYDLYSIDVLAVGGRRPGHFRNDSDFLNWQLGALYKPAKNASFYVSYGSSSNPTGEQVDGAGDAYGGVTAATENLKPERNKQIEVGVKWNVLDKHLALTAAVYRINKTNARVQESGGVVALEGRQRVQGVEVGFSGNISKAWSVYGGASILSAKITGSPDPTQIGAKLPNVAEKSFTAMSRYQLSHKLHVGGQASYVGKRYGGTAASIGTYIPSYWRFDAFAGYQLTDRVSISVNVLNATDKTYYDALYRSSTPFVYVAPGRSALFSLDVDL